MAHDPEPLPLSPSASFSRDDRRALQVQRDRYRESVHFFSPRQSARLCFLRWLYRTGRLPP